MATSEIPDVLRSLVEDSPDGFALVEAGRYVWVNRAFSGLLGAPPERLLGRPMEAHLAEEDRATLSSWWADPGRGGLDLRFFGEYGVGRTLRLEPLRGLRLHERSVEGFLARDVTGKRRVEAELLVADRMMSIGALAAGVAHDINNPLSYVLGNLEFLNGELPALLEGVAEPLREDLTESVKEAQQGAERVRRIVGDLRAFARADPFLIQELDPVRVIEAAVNMAFVELRHRARLERDLAPLPPIRANEARLGQVVLNLLLNSAHAMKEGETAGNLIRIATRDLGDEVELEVSDNGPGIPEELLGRVFDPFFTTKPHGFGTGLGLAMVKGVVAELGGQVLVDSRLGEGTRFLVRLPTAEARARLESGDIDPTGARVLVVDDDPLILGTLRRALEQAGHAVVTAEGGESAVARLARDAGFDVVLCDLLMPGLDGMALCRWLEEHHPELVRRTVFMSGGVFTPRVAEFLATREHRLLDKPFELELALATVRQVRSLSR